MAVHVHLGVKQIRVYETNCLQNQSLKTGKGVDTTSLNNFYTNYRNVPKFSDKGNFAGINLKLKNRGQILGYFVKKEKKKMQMEEQTVQTQIRLLLDPV